MAAGTSSKRTRAPQVKVRLDRQTLAWAGQWLHPQMDVLEKYPNTRRHRRLLNWLAGMRSSALAGYAIRSIQSDDAQDFVDWCFACVGELDPQLFVQQGPPYIQEPDQRHLARAFVRVVLEIKAALVRPEGRQTRADLNPVLLHQLYEHARQRRERGDSVSAIERTVDELRDRFRVQASEETVRKLIGEGKEVLRVIQMLDALSPDKKVR